MTSATLLGGHVHETLNGVRLNISMRCGMYMARGYYDGRPIGPTLGNDENDAAAELRRIMYEMERGIIFGPPTP